MSLSPVVPTIHNIERSEQTTEQIPSRSHIALATQTKIRNDTIFNWSGIQPIANRSQIYFPENEQQVSMLVRSARAKVHCIGSGLSYEKIMSLSKPEDILLNMDNFKGLISITDKTATFGASTTVNDIIAILGEHDRMMPASPGVIGIQTIGGAISTGTHGQGMFQCSYGDTVQSLRVVLPNGQIRKIDDTDEEYPLNAFITSVGMLGVILSVELRTAPRQVLYCKKSTCGFDQFLNEYPSWNENHQHVKAWWFPETDICHIWKVDGASKEQYKSFLRTERRTPLESEENSDAMNYTVGKYMSAMSHDTKSDHKTSTQKQFETIKRFADARDLVGYTEQILCKGIPVPQINCEIAIPFHHFEAATVALRDWNAKNPGRLHYPFIYRAVGKSDVWINAPSVGPMVWIGFLVYVAEDGTVRADGMETMYEIQKILASFGGYPHWGKHFVPELYDFGKLPHWTKFVQLRGKVDPTGKFLSKFMHDNVVKKTMTHQNVMMRARL